MRIALVEDDCMVREAMVDWLCANGAAVAPFASAEAALADPRLTRADAAISDLDLCGGMNGLEFLRQARATMPPSAAAILMTGNHLSPSLDEARQESMLVLLKPIQPYALLGVLRTCRTDRHSEAWRPDGNVAAAQGARQAADVLKETARELRRVKSMVTVQVIGDLAVIQIRGRMDRSVHDAFRHAIDTVNDSTATEIEVDFGDVHYIDSTALGFLLILRDEAQARNKRVSLINCRGAAKVVLDIANFGKLFLIGQTED